jgi:hypothetical protein
MCPVPPPPALLKVPCLPVAATRTAHTNNTVGVVELAGESDLDVQYITAMARNADTRFHLNDNAGWSTYYWAVEVTSSTDPAMVTPSRWSSGLLNN